MTFKTLNVDTQLPFSFHFHEAKSVHAKQKPELLAIFLHGYTDHGSSFLKRLFPDGNPEDLPNDRVSLLAPNGPFPVPVPLKEGLGFKEAYSWYFFDPYRQVMLVTPETALKACRAMIRDVGGEDVPKVLIGYSQGGYLAPMLAQQISHVREIIAVGTGYRPEEYAKLDPSQIVLTGLHGDQDEIFKVDEARKNHAGILKLGFKGEFESFANVGHIAAPEMGQAIEQRFQKNLSRS